MLIIVENVEKSIYIYLFEFLDFRNVEHIGNETVFLDINRVYFVSFFE